LKEYRKQGVDGRAFAILAALAAGMSQKKILAKFRVGKPILLRITEDADLRERFELEQVKTREQERRERAERVAATVLQTGSIKASAAEHGISCSTVYRDLELVGLPPRVRELVETQKTMVEFAAWRALHDVIGEVERSAADPECPKLRERTAALEGLRKVVMGDGGGSSVNVAVGGTAIAGGKVAALNLPAPVHEQDLPPHKLHALARAVIEAESIEEDEEA